jgi:hypothetical protein
MDLAFWRDLSLIWLSLLCFVGLIIPLGIFYFAVKGLGIALDKVAPVLHKGQNLSRQLRLKTDTISQKVVTPVLRTGRETTKAKVTFRTLWSGLTHRDQ